MAQRRKRRTTKRKTQRKTRQSEYPGWVWMLFGLAIGLSVAFAVYVKDREPNPVVARNAPEPASMQSAMDDNGESGSDEAPQEPVKERFDFYKMLPAFEIDVDDVGETTDDSAEPRAIEQPGIYILQAGSFSTPTDADRRRAELGLQGIESYVHRAQVNKRDYYRVYIGPIDDLDELNVTRSRLRAAKIDVMRIRVGD
ncbi:MAG: SPOR domain-containing protein [Pseudomonadota bacterium]